jgi:DegV family protein with EDD domain
MRDYVLFTDSTTDITAAMAEELQLEVMNLSWTMGDKNYINYLDGREMSAKAFYDRLRNGEMGTTTQVNPNAFEEAFRPYLEAGKDILYIGFSSGLSATFNSSIMARETLLEEFPDAKIYCVDSLCASMGEGLLVWHAAQQKKEGKTIDELRDWVEENKLRLCHWFTVDDLKHLQRGGRLSAGQAFVGSLLNIKPVLHVDNNGKLIPKEKVRGRKKALTALVDKMAENVEAPEEQVIFISHGDSLADAEFVASLIRDRWQVKNIYLNDIGPVIGAHSGADTIALFYLGSSR